MMVCNTKKVIQVFMDCQLKTRNIPTLVKHMTIIYNLMNPDDFEKVFHYCLQEFFLISKKEPVVDRVLDFVSKFASSINNVKNECNKENMNKNDALLDDDDEEDDEDSMHEFTYNLFVLLSENHDNQSLAIRTRSAELLYRLLCDFGVGFSIDDVLFEKIKSGMLERLEDVCLNVRHHAVLVLSKLQENSKECPITQALSEHLLVEPSPEIRKVILQNIAVNTKNLNTLIRRTLDVSSLIRKTVFKVLSEKVHLKALSIDQRILLVKRGLNDFSETVKESFLNELVKVWMRFLTENIFSLLSSLYCQNNHDVCQQLLKEIFRSKGLQASVDYMSLLNENLVIPLETISCENVFFWRVLIEHVISKDPEQKYLDQILPTCLNFIQYFDQVFKKLMESEQPNEMLRNNFILQQLALIIDSLDLCDEAGRKAIIEFIRKMLLKEATPEDVLNPLMKQYIKLHSDDNQLLSKTISIISDILQPEFQDEALIKHLDLKKGIEIKLGGVKVEISRLKDLLEDSIENQNFEKAAILKKELDSYKEMEKKLLDEMRVVDNGEDGEGDVRNIENQAKNDPKTMVKCLTLVAELLSNTRFSRLNESILTILDSLIEPGLISTDKKVRNLAFQCLGTCCLRDIDKARQYLPMQIQAVIYETEEVRETALKNIGNFLLLYGVPVVQGTEEALQDTLDENKNKTNFEEDKNFRSKDSGDPHLKDWWSILIKFLLTQLDSENRTRMICCNELCKLLYVGRVYSPSLFSRLLLLWYNPVTEDDPELREMMSSFFLQFSSKSRNNKDIITDSFFLSMKSLFEAPPSSPLSSVSILEVARFLSQLSLVHQMPLKDGSCPHDNLAEGICNWLMKEGLENRQVKVLSGVLSELNITFNNADFLKRLRVLLKKIIKMTSLKEARTSLRKMNERVDCMLQELMEEDANISLLDDTLIMDEQDEVKAELIDKMSTSTSASQSSMVSEKVNGKEALDALIEDDDDEDDFESLKPSKQSTSNRESLMETFSELEETRFTRSKKGKKKKFEIN